MELKKILDPQIIQIGMKTQDKESTIKELIGKLKTHGYVHDEELFLNDIYQREAEGATGIGNFIAIPHGKSNAVDKVGVAIGVLEHEIEWETLDEHGVKIVILFSVGSDVDGAQKHLKLLSTFARKLGNDDVVDNLLKSNSVQDVINAFISEKN